MLAVAVILVTLSVIPLAYQITPTQQTTPTIAQGKFVEALKAVQAANQAGATNTELSQDVRDLNAALSMINQSEHLENQGNTLEANNLAQQALSVLTNVESSAANLQASAEARSLQNRIVTYALAPILSLIVVLLFHYGSISYRKYRAARVMKMIVRVKHNEKQN